jgi:hypothetical protein
LLKSKEKSYPEMSPGICGRRIFDFNRWFTFRVIPAQKKRQVSHYTLIGKIKILLTTYPLLRSESVSATLCFDCGLVTAGQSGGGRPDRFYIERLIVPGRPYLFDCLRHLPVSIR